MKLNEIKGVRIGWDLAAEKDQMHYGMLNTETREIKIISREEFERLYMCKWVGGEVKSLKSKGNGHHLPSHL